MAGIKTAKSEVATSHSSIHLHRQSTPESNKTELLIKKLTITPRNCASEYINIRKEALRTRLIEGTRILCLSNAIRHHNQYVSVVMHFLSLCYTLQLPEYQI